MEHLNTEYETLKKELQENETHSQVSVKLRIIPSVVSFLVFWFSHTHEAFCRQNLFIPSQ